MTTQSQRSKVRKFWVNWIGGGSDELYGYTLEDALKREGMPKSAVECSREMTISPEEEEQFNREAYNG